MMDDRLFNKLVNEKTSDYLCDCGAKAEFLVRNRQFRCKKHAKELQAEFPDANDLVVKLGGREFIDPGKFYATRGGHPVLDVRVDGLGKYTYPVKGSIMYTKRKSVYNIWSIYGEMDSVWHKRQDMDLVEVTEDEFHKLCKDHMKRTVK